MHILLADDREPVRDTIAAFLRLEPWKTNFGENAPAWHEVCKKAAVPALRGGFSTRPSVPFSDGLMQGMPAES